LRVLVIIVVSPCDEVEVCGNVHVNSCVVEVSDRIARIRRTGFEISQRRANGVVRRRAVPRIVLLNQ
jgi:hypothetical protein